MTLKSLLQQCLDQTREVLILWAHWAYETAAANSRLSSFTLATQSGKEPSLIVKSPFVSENVPVIVFHL
jgi:hypothetical protein